MCGMVGEVEHMQESFSPLPTLYVCTHTQPSPVQSPTHPVPHKVEFVKV